MILVAGNINYDILLPLERPPGPHEKIQCDNATTGFGGSAANSAWWLARMGLPVTLAGTVGEDLYGEAQLAELEKAGVLVSGVDRIKGSSGLAVVFSLGREKRMVRVPGANVHGQVHLELLECCQMVYLSGNNTSVISSYAFAAHDKGIPVVCGWHGAASEDVAGVVDGFILNADEAEKITGLKSPSESIAALDVDFAAVTLPSGGCVVSRGIDIHVIAAPELEPLDRTGGGDAFAAAFLAGAYRGLDIRNCGEMGNVLAALVIMGKGARPEISIPEELKFQASRPAPGS